MYFYNSESAIETESELHEHTHAHGLSWSLWIVWLVCIAIALVAFLVMVCQIHEMYNNEMSADNKYTISAQLDKPGFLFVLH